MRIDSSRALGGVQSGSNLFVSSGAVIQPTISFNSALMQVTIGEGKYRTFPYSTDFSGVIREFVIPETVLAVAQNTKYYVCVVYNDGNPLMYLETDSSQINDSNILVIYTIFTEVNDIDVLDWDSEAVGLPNKLNERFIDTQRFGRAFGLELTSSNSILTSAGGEVYIGSNKLFFDQCVSNVDECELLIKNGTGGWDVTDVSVFPNTKYDSGGSGLVDLTDNQYGVCWVWRAMGSAKELYIVMGTASYVSLDSAKQSKIPSDLLERVTLGSVFIGRAIFLKGSSSATVESAFDTVFNASTPTQHNSLLGIQGGLPSNHYHITSAEYTNYNKLVNVLTNSSKVILYQTSSNNNTLTSAGGYQKLTLTLSTEVVSGGFTVNAPLSRIEYVGVTKRFAFNATATVSGVTTNNTVINFMLYKNTNTPLNQTTSAIKLASSTDKNTINAASGFVLNNGDYIEIFADVDKNVTFTTESMQIQIIEDLANTFTTI